MAMSMCNGMIYVEIQAAHHQKMFNIIDIGLQYNGLADWYVIVILSKHYSAHKLVDYG